MPKREKVETFIGGETPEKRRKAEELLRDPPRSSAYEVYLEKLKQDPLVDSYAFGWTSVYEHIHYWTGSGRIINFIILNKRAVHVAELEVIGEDFDFETSACIDSTGLTIDDVVVKEFESDVQVFFVAKICSKLGLPEIEGKHIYVLPD